MDTSSALGCNLFVYSRNDPVNKIDPTGLLLEELFTYLSDVANEIGKAIQQYSTEYAACGGLAVLDGPLPFGDAIGVIGAGLLTIWAIGEGLYNKTNTTSISIPSKKALYESKRLPKISAKEKVLINSITKRNFGQINYWAAEIQNNTVLPMVPLTYAQAQEWVAGGRNLLCRDHASAVAIVKFWPSARWESRHGCVNSGYMNHYHLSSAHGNHIWYYGE